jgi:hypothetical protein
VGPPAHRLILRALAAGLVAVASAACGAQEHGSSRPGSPAGLDLGATIPWVDSRPRPVIEPVPSPGPTAATCRAENLRIAGDRVGAASGTYDNISVRNTGHMTCTLSGYPSLTGMDARHHRVVVPTKRGTQADDRRTEQRPATIAPGGIANVTVFTSTACDPGKHDLAITGVGLGVGGGGELRTDVRLVTTCRVGVGRWHVDVSPMREPTWPSHGLTASLELPDAAVAGEAMSYVLVLRNDTDADAPLTPCPSYDENVQPVQGKVVGAHQLNCAVQVVRAHSAVRYEMRLQVPRDQQPVPCAHLTWETTPSGLRASGVFAITSAAASPSDGRRPARPRCRAPREQQHAWLTPTRPRRS